MFTRSKLVALLPLALVTACASTPAGSSTTTSTSASSGAAPTKTAVLVHGAWADGSSWDKVVPLLEAKGFKVVVVQNPLTSLADDVAAARTAIDQQTGPVVLVGHSWGGVVITEAGNDPKVGALVYVAAFAPDDGQSINDLTNNAKPPYASGIHADSKGFLSLSPEVISQDFAQDLPAETTRQLTAIQKPLAASAFGDKVSKAAWRTKPTAFVVASQDHMIPPDLERAEAAKMNATVTTVDSSHVAMISHPQEVANAIAAAADRAR